jgi:class 3 adenylate cyclase/tetratricopeptide (TPR) repeat protein
VDIGAWLKSLNLSQYEAAFRANHIDAEVLGDLSATDLEKLGVSLGHRLRLLKAIRALREPQGVAKPAARDLAAQRRQLTVSFCDLVGSTELSARLDPEDMHELIADYQRCCVGCIERAGGFVAKYMGDGVLAYFGYPQAHEDDPARAIQAALEIREAVPQVANRHGLRLAARIGIATGLVVVGDVVGDGWSQERSVVGETPNLAARLQGIAPPNGVVVSHATRSLATGLFEYRDVGAVSLKGLTLSDPVWEVVGANTIADRFDARHALTPMVDREEETRRILELWQRRAAGAGHIVGIVGDPGIGKSRLILEVHQKIAAEPHVWIEGGGAQIFRNTPFYTLSQMIRRLLGHQETTAEVCASLERALVLADVSEPDAVPLIAELLGVPTPDQAAPLTLSAEERRSRVISVVTDWLIKIAARRATVLFVEDIHWVDPSTLQVLDCLIERAPAAALFILYTARKDFDVPWPVGRDHTRIALERLDADCVRDLVVAAASRTLPDDVIAKILARADGVPLFAEELARLVTERNSGAADREIPSTLSDLLMARLDKLGPAKDIAQIAAVLGREISYRLIEAVSGVEEKVLRASLSRLIEAEILIHSGATPDDAYSFKHALLEDAAYGALLKRQRLDLHRRAATVIAEQFSQIAGERPEILAQHWTEAGDPTHAIPVWQKAGRLATSRRALKEAQSAYEQAIVLLATLPQTPDRDLLEFSLQSALAQVLQITRGYSAPQTVAAMSRTRQLAGVGGPLSPKLRQAQAEWAAASSAGDYVQAGGLADQFLGLAQADGRPANLAQAHMIQMTSLYRIGDLMGAEEAFRMGAPYFESPDFIRRPGVSAQTFGNAALIAWMMDDSDRAQRRMEAALALSLGTGHPYDLTFAQSMSAVFAVLASDLEKAEAVAVRSLALCQEHGFPQIAPISKIVLGRARAGLGRGAEGIALIREGMRAMEEAGIRVAMTEYLTWLGEAQAFWGAPDDAVQSVDEALRTNPQELFFRPESLRLRGEFHLALGRIASAKADFSDAMTLAKGMGAKRFHARSAASLERLDRA